MVTANWNSDGVSIGILTPINNLFLYLHLLEDFMCLGGKKNPQPKMFMKHLPMVVLASQGLFLKNNEYSFAS